MVNIGHIAKTYGILPSKVIQEATTFDLMITDVYTTWERYQHEKSSGKTPMPDLTTDDMLEMMKKAKERNI